MVIMMTIIRIAIILLVLKFIGLDAEPVQVRAARGRDARIPCGQGRVFLDGEDAYVLWLKDDRDFVYRYPNDESQRRAASRDRIYGITCESGTCHDDTTLLIKKATDRDAGLYRCRIHLQASPSVDYVVNVAIVDSTGFPKLFNGDGDEINEAYLGPLSLGSDISLVCEVENYDAYTEVYWSRNGVLLKRAHNTGPGILRVHVHLFNLTRAEQDATYECIASNSDISEPLKASIVVKMYLPPLSVEIRLNRNYDFEDGQPRVVDCVVIGCVPTPTITWHLGDVMVRSTVHKELHDGNYTVSSLTLAPSLRDHHKELMCRAHNSHLPGELFQDKVTVNVGYRPICQDARVVKLGAVAGEAETVTCFVDALPQPLQFSWTFADNKILYTGVTKETGHRERYSSNLTWITRESDIGLLHCRAVNTFGEQKRPCTYNISRGGPPPVPDCKLRRAYPHSLRAQCKKGWDGGRPQTIYLEILDEEGVLIRNASDVAGHFFVPNVEESRNLTAILYAKNSRGKSNETVVYLETLAPLAPAAENNYITSAWMPYLEGFAVFVALVSAATLITIGLKILAARRQGVEDSPDEPPSDGVFHREPDFIREERLLGTTNITVNQLAACQNQYSSSPLPACRLLLGCGPHSPSDTCLTSQHSYYV